MQYVLFQKTNTLFFFVVMNFIILENDTSKTFDKNFISIT